MCAEKGVKALCADHDSTEDVSLMLRGTSSNKAVMGPAVKRPRDGQSEISKVILTQYPDCHRKDSIPEGTGLHVSNRRKTICRIS